MVLLEANNIKKSFGKTEVLKGISFSLNQGEVLAIIGSSGSGKSLLASAILGILPGNATVRGHLHYKGEELSPERQAELRGTEQTGNPFISS